MRNITENAMVANISKVNESSSANGSSPSSTEGIAMCSAFALICVLVVVGNLVTIVLFTVNKRLGKKSLYLVINMAFADFMYGVLSVPFFIYFELGVYFYQLWTMGDSDLPIFYFYLVVDRIFSAASLLSVTCISYERFYAIYRPFKHRSLTARHYKIVIFFIWALAFLHSACSLFYSGKFYIYFWILMGVVLSFIIVACYVAIWLKFHKGSVATQQQNRDAQNVHLTKTLLLVSITTLICWLPLIAVSDLHLLNVEISWRYYVFSVFLNYCNSFINAIVYALKLPEFREGMAASCCVHASPVRRQEAGNPVNSNSRNNQAAFSITQVIHK